MLRSVFVAFSIQSARFPGAPCWSSGGLCITTYPDRSRCSTKRAAVIRAITSSESCTRFRPLNRRANDRDCVNFGAATDVTSELSDRLVCLLLSLQTEAATEITESTRATDLGRKRGTLQSVRFLLTGQQWLSTMISVMRPNLKTIEPHAGNAPRTKKTPAGRAKHTTVISTAALASSSSPAAKWRWGVRGLVARVEVPRSMTGRAP